MVCLHYLPTAGETMLRISRPAAIAGGLHEGAHLLRTASRPPFASAAESKNHL